MNIGFGKWKLTIHWNTEEKKTEWRKESEVIEKIQIPADENLVRKVKNDDMYFFSFGIQKIKKLGMEDS